MKPLTTQHLFKYKTTKCINLKAMAFFISMFIYAIFPGIGLALLFIGIPSKYEDNPPKWKNTITLIAYIILAIDCIIGLSLPIITKL